MRVMVPLGKPQPWVLPITLVCLALGALIASMLSISTAQPTDMSKMRPEDQVKLLQIKVSELETQNAELNKEKQKFLENIANEKKSLALFLDELNSLRIRAGTTAVEGPGIAITLDDTNIAKPTMPEVNEGALLIHDMDLLMLVNELRAAGAEAIALNDQRVVYSTAIRCVGPVIYVNNRPVSAPFVVKAIGKQDALAGAANLPFGVLEQLKPLGIQISVAKRDKIRLPAVAVLPPFEKSRAVKDEETTSPSR